MWIILVQKPPELKKNNKGPKICKIIDFFFAKIAQLKGPTSTGYLF